jgi:hypothetical protein
MNPSIEIVILSRDRLPFLISTIDSVLSQKGSVENITIVVSDNSLTNDVEKYIEANNLYLKLSYRKRVLDLSSTDHFKIVVSESISDYIVLFHDDDLMHKNYIKTMLSFISLNKEVVLIGGNGIQFVDGTCSDRGQRISLIDKVLFFDTKKDFLSQYLVGSKGVIPFPGYIYKTTVLKELDVDNLPGGKYKDVAILSEMLDFGKVACLPDILMSYRIHSNNDSRYENIVDRISLLNYISRQGVEKNSLQIALFRARFWSKWVLQQKKFRVFGWREFIVCKFIVNVLLRSMISRVFWVATYNKLTRFYKIRRVLE